jgi:hypothetical protein
MNTEQIYQLKLYIKSLYNDIVYTLIKEYNRNNNKFKLVIAGGDALYYYINDEIAYTKDFDVKIVSSDFTDWKMLYDNTLDPTGTNIINTFREQCTFRNQFVSELRQELDRSIHLVLNNINALLQPQGYQIQNLNFRYENAYMFGTLKTEDDIDHLMIDQYDNDRFKAWIRFLDLNIRSNNIQQSSRASILYSFVIRNTNNNSITNTITEGIIDAVIWSPIVYEPYLYNTIMYKILLNTDDVTQNKFSYSVDEIQRQEDIIIYRNFSFVENHDHLSVISIGFCIWDTIRMANKTIQSYYNNPSDDNKNYSKKYAKKYWAIIDSLFNKLKCTPQFINACQTCIATPTTFEQYNIESSNNIRNKLLHL